MNLDLVEQIGGKDLHHVVPDVNSQVFCGAGSRGAETRQVDADLIFKNKRWFKSFIPDNSGKVRDVLVQVFMVQRDHDDLLQVQKRF